MKNRIGLFFIVLSCFFTSIVWSFSEPISTVSIYRQYSQLLASISLVILTWVFFISTRHRAVDSLFHGLDKAYAYHRYLSMLTVILIWVHKATIDLGKIRVAKSAKPIAASWLASLDWTHVGKGAASLSLTLFTGFVLFAVVAAKLEYQKWKLLHKLMLIPFFLGIVHYYANSDYPALKLDPYGVWMNLIILIGVSSAVYSIFLYEKTAFNYKYRVDQIKKVATDTIEISASALGAELQYKPGQYAFIKTMSKEDVFPSHPFSISQAPTPGRIQFTIKASGDHTVALQYMLAEGDVLALSGPHGKFDYQTGVKRQIWIAGGIGITPFRSFYQSQIPADYSIDLFYAYADEQAGAYVDELKQLEAKNENLRIHLIDGSAKKRLSVESIAKFIDVDTPFDVYFCGPKGMRDQFKKTFAASPYPMKAFNYDEFQFK